LRSTASPPWRRNRSAKRQPPSKAGEDGTTMTGRWDIAEDFTNYATDFELIYRRVDTR
jgi:hypothetical protein